MGMLEEMLRERMQRETRSYLDQLSQKGARISVEGQVLSLNQIARLLAMNEGFCYMPDFQTDETGKLVEIRFDRVRLQ